LQLLADEYKGKVRFGIVDIKEEEAMKMSYFVLTLPQTFLIKDGTVYEMNVLNIFYDNVRSFIEGNYLKEASRYTTFPVPRYLLNQVTIYGAYAYRDGLRLWNDKSYDTWEYLKENNYTEISQVKAFFD